ncbi:MAG: hypothetical protein OEY62_01695 [Acidimicrobiia bacterium]|nr:hypothetical protein [Acidimicrobiia bacterium]
MNSDDPHGKRSLFESARPTDPSENHARGRQALFSTAAPRPGTVVVECSQCGEHKRIQTGDALTRILRVSLWVPLLKHNRWMRCPSCERRTWCRVGWLD